MKTTWTELITAVRITNRPEGEGWKTCREFARETGIHKESARQHLVALLDKGLVETAKFRCGTRVVNCYRPVNEKAKGIKNKRQKVR